MQHLWQRSLLGRTVGNIIVITLLVGGLIMLAMSISVARQTEADAYRRLGELLDTVEDTVRVACFVGDEQLATEVARGLIRNSEVLAVDIRSDKGLLAHVQRDLAPENMASEKQAVFGSQPVHRNIVSPFEKSMVVGNIALQPDGAAIDSLVAQARSQIALQMLLLIVAVAIALTLTVLRQVRQANCRALAAPAQARPGRRRAVGRTGGARTERLRLADPRHQCAERPPGQRPRSRAAPALPP